MCGRPQKNQCHMWARDKHRVVDNISRYSGTTQCGVIGLQQRLNIIFQIEQQIGGQFASNSKILSRVHGRIDEANCGTIHEVR